MTTDNVRKFVDVLAAVNPLSPAVAPDPYVVVTIPRSLEASARLAIAGLYQPFFVEWAQDVIVLITRAVEWAHVAPRFPGASVQSGFRLISLGVPAGDPPGPGGAADPLHRPNPTPPDAAVLPALVRALERRGIRARTLRSFYRDHLLVAEGDLAACLEALTAFPGLRPDSSSGG